jgi:hypothetical protein
MARYWRGLCPAVDCTGLMMMMNYQLVIFISKLTVYLKLEGPEYRRTGRKERNKTQRKVKRLTEK